MVKCKQHELHYFIAYGHKICVAVKFDVEAASIKEGHRVVKSDTKSYY